MFMRLNSKIWNKLKNILSIEGQVLYFLDDLPSHWGVSRNFSHFGRLTLLAVSFVDPPLNAFAAEPEAKPYLNRNSSKSGLTAFLLPHSNLPPALNMKIKGIGLPIVNPTELSTTKLADVWTRKSHLTCKWIIKCAGTLAKWFRELCLISKWISILFINVFLQSDGKTWIQQKPVIAENLLLHPQFRDEYSCPSTILRHMTQNYRELSNLCLQWAILNLLSQDICTQYKKSSW